MTRVALALLLILPALAGCVDGDGGGERVHFETITFDTAEGAFTAILYPEAAPETVALMKTYAAEGYYLGRSFGRVIPGFVIQENDRLDGATDDSRRVPLEPHADYHFSAGALGIARSADPGSGGPEFFVMDFATSHLDGNYTVWGQVIEGMDVVNRIARSPALTVSQLHGTPAGPLCAPAPVPQPQCYDSYAVIAATIQGVSLGSVDMDDQDAAVYPLRVATRMASDDAMHSLDYPADLRVGHANAVSWYARPLAGTEVAAPDAVRVQVGNATLPVRGAPDADGVYRFQWTPVVAGDVPITLLRSGQPWATLFVNVAP